MIDLRRMALLRIFFFCFFGFGLSPHSDNCFARDATDSPKGKNSVDILSASNTSLAPFQNQLLDLAFETASAIPANPHRKDRARVQEDIVEICLRLGQPRRAAGYIEQIDNWRRGFCYADLAFYCAQQGCRGDAQSFLQQAETILKTTDEERKDRIRVRIAQTYVLLGQKEKVEEFEKDIADSEAGKVSGVRAMICADDSFDEQMESLDKLMATGGYDVLSNALKSCVQLFDRFYNDPQRRSLVEEKIEQSWEKLPILIRIKRLMEMAESALDHSDSSQAIEFIHKAQSMMDGCKWPLEPRVSLTAQLAELRFRAGHRDKARSDLDRARSLLNGQGNTIVDIYRAGVFRSLAQAYRTLEVKDVSLAIYKQAVEIGVINPNSRPRAEDLAAACASMALNAIEPDAQLWTRIHQIREGLGQPW